ncbi:unnamed protein product [Nippostrongylus brasiliensis]|uniref:S1-like domain-containing protein n=1 Tax=Nippostrongylus brasiliensis TaxID=27835 RepID=A0A0N4XDV5_NIPBR|nr:unnamed protein product [Nippostrongylus brasiliensis]
MPKNKGKGGKNRRRGTNENDLLKRELDTKDVGREVSKMLGNVRVLAFCFDGKQRVCHTRGSLRKKVWTNTGDIILVGLSDYQDDEGDGFLKYTPDKARRLKQRRISSESEDDEGEEEDNNMPSSDVKVTKAKERVRRRTKKDLKVTRSRTTS